MPTIRRFVASQYHGKPSKELGWWGTGGLHSRDNQYHVESVEGRFHHYLELVDEARRKLYPITAKRKSFFPPAPRRSAPPDNMYDGVHPCLPEVKGFCVTKIDWTDQTLRLVLRERTDDCGDRDRLFEVPYTSLHAFRWDPRPSRRESRSAHVPQADQVIHTCRWIEKEWCYHPGRGSSYDYRCLTAVRHALRDRYYQINYGRSVPRPVPDIIKDLETTTSALADDYVMFSSTWGKDKKTRIANVKAARAAGREYLHYLFEGLVKRRSEPTVRNALARILRKGFFKQNLTQIDPALLEALRAAAAAGKSTADRPSRDR
jgi:hypothetical protein